MSCLGREIQDGLELVLGRGGGAEPLGVGGDPTLCVDVLLLLPML
jgi:hypothetical protein